MVSSGSGTVLFPCFSEYTEKGASLKVTKFPGDTEQFRVVTGS